MQPFEPRLVPIWPSYPRAQGWLVYLLLIQSHSTHTHPEDDLQISCSTCRVPVESPVFLYLLTTLAPIIPSHMTNLSQPSIPIGLLCRSSDPRVQSIWVLT